MSDLLSEVLKDHSDEQNLKKFKKILPIVIVLTIIVAIVMYGMNYYKVQKVAKNAKDGDLIYHILNNGEEPLNNYENSSELLELKKVLTNSNNISYDSQLQQLEIIANNQNFNDITRAYSRLLILATIIKENNNAENYQKTFDSNIKYFLNENDLFFCYANILYANWLVQNHKIDQAILILNNLILSAKVPQILKEQARAAQFNINNKF